MFEQYLGSVRWLVVRHFVVLLFLVRWGQFETCMGWLTWTQDWFLGQDFLLVLLFHTVGTVGGWIPLLGFHCSSCDFLYTPFTHCRCRTHHPHPHLPTGLHTPPPTPHTTPRSCLPPVTICTPTWFVGWTFCPFAFACLYLYIIFTFTFLPYIPLPFAPTHILFAPALPYPHTPHTRFTPPPHTHTHACLCPHTPLYHHSPKQTCTLHTLLPFTLDHSPCYSLLTVAFFFFFGCLPLWNLFFPHFVLWGLVWFVWFLVWFCLRLHCWDICPHALHSCPLPLHCTDTLLPFTFTVPPLPPFCTFLCGILPRHVQDILILFYWFPTHTQPFVVVYPHPTHYTYHMVGLGLDIYTPHFICASYRHVHLLPFYGICFVARACARIFALASICILCTFIFFCV